MAAPPRKPPPAPIAAPVAGLPAAAPMAAPAAAPTAVPMAAPLIVLWLDVRSVVVPVCCADHWRQTASSVWNCSKLLPAPGNTNTLGPVGIDAHAPRPSAAPTETTANLGAIHFISRFGRRQAGISSSTRPGGSFPAPEAPSSTSPSSRARHLVSAHREDRADEPLDPKPRVLPSGRASRGGIGHVERLKRRARSVKRAGVPKQAWFHAQQCLLEAQRIAVASGFTAYSGRPQGFRF